jgi:hypothetical protein
MPQYMSHHHLHIPHELPDDGLSGPKQVKKSKAIPVTGREGL